MTSASVHLEQGIPTTYRGIRFRSRAEACWASFFDSLKWTWDYEPIDLDGYIPDFLIAGDSGKQVLFEVKGGVVGIHMLNDHTAKIEKSGWDSEAVVVGAMPCNISDHYYVVGVASSPEQIDGETAWQWDSCEFFYCLSCGQVSFMNPSKSWACRLCGADDGNSHIGNAHAMVRDAWTLARNRVQWRAA
jgi:hypothetical protein